MRIRKVTKPVSQCKHSGHSSCSWNSGCSGMYTTGSSHHSIDSRDELGHASCIGKRCRSLTLPPSSCPQNHYSNTRHTQGYIQCSHPSSVHSDSDGSGGPFHLSHPGIFTGTSPPSHYSNYGHPNPFRWVKWGCSNLSKTCQVSCVEGQG